MPGAFGFALPRARKVPHHLEADRLLALDCQRVVRCVPRQHSCGLAVGQRLVEGDVVCSVDLPEFRPVLQHLDALGDRGFFGEEYGDLEAGRGSDAGHARGGVAGARERDFGDAAFLGEARHEVGGAILERTGRLAGVVLQEQPREACFVAKAPGFPHRRVADRQGRKEFLRYRKGHVIRAPVERTVPCALEDALQRSFSLLLCRTGVAEVATRLDIVLGPTLGAFIKPPHQLLLRLKHPWNYGKERQENQTTETRCAARLAAPQGGSGGSRTFTYEPQAATVRWDTPLIPPVILRTARITPCLRASVARFIP